jgi:hypothetical protein
MAGDPFSLGQRTTVTPPADTRAFPGAEGSPSVIGPASFSIRAHHGTPHKVDKFTTGKIGTGEGAQAYGYGFYAAGTSDVAQAYRLGNKSHIPDGEVMAYATIRSHKQEPAADTQFAKLYPQADLATVKQNYAQYSGNLYTLSLNLEDEQLLDWDKPIDQQGQFIKDALATAGASGCCLSAEADRRGSWQV